LGYIELAAKAEKDWELEKLGFKFKVKVYKFKSLPSS